MPQVPPCMVLPPMHIIYMYMLYIDDQNCTIVLDGLARGQLMQVCICMKISPYEILTFGN